MNWLVELNFRQNTFETALTSHTFYLTYIQPYFSLHATFKDPEEWSISQVDYNIELQQRNRRPVT